MKFKLPPPRPLLGSRASQDSSPTAPCNRCTAKVALPGQRVAPLTPPLLRSAAFRARQPRPPSTESDERPRRSLPAVFVRSRFLKSLWLTPRLPAENPTHCDLAPSQNRIARQPKWTECGWQSEGRRVA